MQPTGAARPWNNAMTERKTIGFGRRLTGGAAPAADAQPLGLMRIEYELKNQYNPPDETQ